MVYSRIKSGRSLANASAWPLVAALLCACGAETATPADSLAADAMAAETSTDTAGSDTSASLDSAPLDTAFSVDTGPLDTDSPDSGVLDSGPLDTTPQDTDSPDTSSGDTTSLDTAPLDTAAPDTSSLDTASPDTAGPPVCVPTAPTTEVCDGQDNDCDGTTDLQLDGQPPLCEDGNVCTTDICDKAKGCVQLPVASGKGNCSDSDPCTLGETCSAGACMNGKPACNDSDPCTADACDPQSGACSHAPIANCKACKLAADCGDANDCTSDACTAGLCAWKPIVGCIGPTDPYIKELTLLAPSVQAPGGVNAKLWLENLGKSVIKTGTLALEFSLYQSADAKIDAGDLWIGGSNWSGDPIGGPVNIKDYMDIQFGYEDLAKAKPGKQFACVRIQGGGDVNPANNDACAPLEVKFPAWKLVEITPPTGDVFAKAEINVGLKILNSAGTDLKAPVAIYLSQDATWDDKDTKISVLYDNVGMGIGTVKAGATTSFSAKATIPAAYAPGKPWLCAVVAVASHQLEELPADNILCKQLDNLRNPADLGLSASNVGFAVAAPSPVFVGNPIYGQLYQCMIKQIANFGDLPVTSPMAARCWVDVAGAAFPGTAGWNVAWSIDSDIGAGYWQNNAQKPAVLNNILSGASPAPGLFRPNHLGVSYVCAHLNHDGAQDEIALANNKVCMKVNIVGHDLYPDAPWTWIGTAPVNNAKLKRGVAYPMQFRVCNKGNANLTNPSKLKTRIFLDQDGKITESDPLIYTGTGIPGYVDIPGKSTMAPGCVNLALSEKITLPMSLAPGGYSMVIDVNKDQAYPDPEADNVAVGFGVVVE